MMPTKPLFDRGTTPHLTFWVKDQTFDLTLPVDTNVTISQGGTRIEKSGVDVEINPETHEITAFYTQEETLRLCAGLAEYQINWLFANGLRADSGEPCPFTIGRTLLGRVMA